MEIFLVLVTVLLTCIGGFFATCYIISLWTGCSSSEAITKLHNFMNGKVQYSFQSDMGFANEVWENVRNIIGNKRFGQLRNLANTGIKIPLLSFGREGGLPGIAISLYYLDENEKQVIEHVLSNLVVKYLRIYGYNTKILVEWKKRNDLNMPVLIIRYARTSEENRILNIHLQNMRHSIIAQNNAITDDTEQEELDE